MKIGMLVKSYIKKIFSYCDTGDHAELNKLMGLKYSKEIFNIGYPFCTETSLIPKEKSKRYWTEAYFVRGKTVRVSSQWVESSRIGFIRYLVSKQIAAENEVEVLSSAVANNPTIGNNNISLRSNARYKGSAIGNAQNLVVRNILSNLGKETFNEEDWVVTKNYFSNCCAYCGDSYENLLMEHAVPINRKSLGEHKLGNLVPSCKSCNATKSDKDFRTFLADDKDRIKIIEEYMDSKNYVPLGDNEQVKMILDMAYQEVPLIAERYVKILNELFSGD